MSDGATPTTNMAEFDYSTLNPTDPASIQALINFHRMTFSGAKMMADEATPPAEPPAKVEPTQPPAQPPAPAETKTEKPADQPLGEGGKKALEAEREAARQAKAELAQFQKQIAAAFGLDKDTKGATPEETIAALANKVAELEKTTLVATIASTHGITDPADLDLIRKQPDEESMTALAARLKAAAPAPAGPSAPKPDPSIGRQGGAKPTNLKDAISAHYSTPQT